MFRYLLNLLLICSLIPGTTFGLEVNGPLNNALMESSASDPVTDVIESRFYWNSTSKQPLIYNGASWVPLGGSGSGSGELNVVSNPSAANVITGWTAGTDHSVARDTSNSPLAPTLSTSIAVSATADQPVANDAGGYTSISTMPTTLRNKKLKLDFYFKSPATATWEIAVYAGSTRLALTTDSSGTTTLPQNTSGHYTTYFVSTDATAYSVHFVQTSNHSTTLYATNVIVGPGIQPQGAADGPVSISWNYVNGTGASFSNNVQSYRNGEYLVLNGSIAITGTGTSGSAFSMSMTGINPAVGQTGHVRIEKTTSGGEHTYLIYSDGTQLTFYKENDGSSGGSAVTVKGTDLGNVTSGDIKTIYLTSVIIKISEWSGSGTVNLAQAGCEYVYNSSTSVSDDSTSFATGTSGGLVPSGTAGAGGFLKRVRFATPIQPFDDIKVKLFTANNQWTPATAGGKIGSGGLTYAPIDATDDIGFGTYQSVSSTDIDIRFYRYRNGTSAWANTDGAKWRVEKCSPEGVSGFDLASASNTGLVSTTTQTFAGAKTFAGKLYASEGVSEGSATSTDNSALIGLSSNIYHSGFTGLQTRENTTTGGGAVVVSNRTTDTNAAVIFYANQASDGLTTQADVVGSISSLGAYSIGPSGFGGTHTVYGTMNVGTGVQTAGNEVWTYDEQTFTGGTPSSSSSGTLTWKCAKSGKMVTCNAFQRAVTNVSNIPCWSGVITNASFRPSDRVFIHYHGYNSGLASPTIRPMTLYVDASGTVCTYGDGSLGTPGTGVTIQSGYATNEYTTLSWFTQ